MANDDNTPAAEQEAHAGKAMDLRNAASAPAHPATDPPAHEGMNHAPNTKIASSGAFHAEGHRPVLERSRKVP